MSDVSVSSPAPAPGRKLRPWQIVVFVVVVALLVLVAIQMQRNGPLAAGPVGQGEAAPTFTLESFGGETINTADLRGKVVVVNFWASWCGGVPETYIIDKNGVLAFTQIGPTDQAALISVIDPLLK